MDAIVDGIAQFFYKIFYGIEIMLCMAVGWLQELFNIFTGISTVSYNGADDYITNVFFGNKITNALYLGFAAIGIVLIFMFSIIAVIKKAFDLDDKMKMSYGQMLRAFLKAFLIIISMNLIMTVSMSFTDELMKAVTKVFTMAPEIAEGDPTIVYTDEQFAAMGRILNTIGNYSLNPSYKSRYNINSCYNDIRIDLKYLADTRVFNYYYGGDTKNGQTWQNAIQQIAVAADYNNEVPIDVYNESIMNAITNCMEIMKTDKSFHALDRFTRHEEYNTTDVPLDVTLFLIGTMGNGDTAAAKNSKYNTNPSMFDDVRGPYYRGEKSIYTFKTVNKDFDIALSKTNYIVVYAGAIVIICNMALIVVNCIVRIFNLLFMYLIAPPVVSTMPLDDGAKFKQWTTAFIVQLFSVFATVISMRLFLVFLPIIMDPNLVLSKSAMVNVIAKLVMIWAGAKGVEKANGILTGILTDNAGAQSLMAGDMKQDLANSAVGRAAQGAKAYAEGKVMKGAGKVLGTAASIATLPTRPITGALSAAGGKIASGYRNLNNKLGNLLIPKGKGGGKGGGGKGGGGGGKGGSSGGGSGSGSSGSSGGSNTPTSQRNMGNKPEGQGGGGDGKKSSGGGSGGGSESGGSAGGEKPPGNASVPGPMSGNSAPGKKPMSNTEKLKQGAKNMKNAKLSDAATAAAVGAKYADSKQISNKDAKKMAEIGKRLDNNTGGAVSKLATGDKNAGPIIGNMDTNQIGGAGGGAGGGEKPGAKPGTKPGAKPGTKPGAKPGTKPNAAAGAGTNQQKQNETGPKAGVGAVPAQQRQQAAPAQDGNKKSNPIGGNANDVRESNVGTGGGREADAEAEDTKDTGAGTANLAADSMDNAFERGANIPEKMSFAGQSGTDANDDGDDGNDGNGNDESKNNKPGEFEQLFDAMQKGYVDDKFNVPDNNDDDDDDDDDNDDDDNNDGGGSGGSSGGGSGSSGGNGAKASNITAAQFKNLFGVDRDQYLNKGKGTNVQRGKTGTNTSGVKKPAGGLGGRNSVPDPGTQQKGGGVRTVSAADTGSNPAGRQSTTGAQPKVGGAPTGQKPTTGTQPKVGGGAPTGQKPTTGTQPKVGGAPTGQKPTTGAQPKVGGAPIGQNPTTGAQPKVGGGGAAMQGSVIDQTATHVSSAGGPIGGSMRQSFSAGPQEKQVQTDAPGSPVIDTAGTNIADSGRQSFTAEAAQPEIVNPTVQQSAPKTEPRPKTGNHQPRQTVNILNENRPAAGGNAVNPVIADVAAEIGGALENGDIQMADAVHEDHQSEVEKFFYSTQTHMDEEQANDYEEADDYGGSRAGFYESNAGRYSTPAAGAKDSRKAAGSGGRRAPNSGRRSGSQNRFVQDAFSALDNDKKDSGQDGSRNILPPT